MTKKKPTQSGTIQGQKGGRRGEKNRDLELLFEVGAQRFVKRSWAQFLTPGMANTSEHTFRVMWIALVIAAREARRGHSVDRGKILLMALAHDVPESRTGDVHYLSRQYTERNEALALADVFFDTSTEQDIVDALREYEERETLEAQIVKDADNLEVDFELAELRHMGSTLPASFAPMRRHVFETKLFTDSAREIWQELQDANPHDWHLNGRNRLRAGDWKQK